MPRQTILAIDDDKPILELVCKTLEAADFDVITSADPVAGLEIATKHRVDLIVLDVRMPGLNGFEVCRRLRATPSTAHTPIVMLTVDAAEPDRIAGLELGADDYIAKPFSPRELVARVRAILRRVGNSSGDASGTVEIGALSIDPARHEVRHQGEAVAMTAMEFKVLHYLAARAGTVVSRDDILHAVIESDAAVLDRTIDVHVAALRRKLKDGGNMIETVRGVGYRMRPSITEPT
jgi:DNA-binding response OmpR family regulator